jgi:trimeric autotransporter adhesin
MGKRLLVLLYFVWRCWPAISQNIGIGTPTPNASAALDITNTGKGLLIPRMTSSAVAAIPNPAKGLMVYDSVKNQLLVNMGNQGIPNWQTIVANSGWGLTGNDGTSPAVNFIGTKDVASLLFKVNNVRAGSIDSMGYANTSFGFRTLDAVNTGAVYNVALGFKALTYNKDGFWNTANGAFALNSNTNGAANTANGFEALVSNTSGTGNTANGMHSLGANTIGQHNTGTGYRSLFYSTTGVQNTATGSQALASNTTADNNTADGNESLYYNTTGTENTASGASSLFSNTTGNDNTAVGFNSLVSNTAGNGNTAVGELSLYRTTNSWYNTVVGYNAGSAHDMGYNNTILGANCDITSAGLFNCIAIGQEVTCNASSQARIGNSATNSIGGYANWTNISDGRYKKNLKEDVKGLAFIMKLRPVTYNLDMAGLSQKLNEGRGKAMNAFMRTAMAEKEKVIQTGFVAQEVEQAANETGYNFSGVDKPKNENDFYGLRYAEFVVPLVKAVQEQQHMMEEMKKRIGALEEQNKLLQQLLNKRTDHHEIK